MDGYPTKSSSTNPLKDDAECAAAMPANQGISPQSPPALSESDWNLNELLERLEGDQEFLHELLLTFRGDYETCL
jgi:hypothetical protein